MGKVITFVCILTTLATAACSQSRERSENSRKVGGQCEGCEAIYEYAAKKLKATDTLPDFNEPGPKLILTGTIFHIDGKTPAKDVILYVYHTDQTGKYSTKGGEKGWAKRHGYIRGWIKTDATGRYTFYTLRPASYPGTKAPAHIHPVVKEPGKNEYWIDEFIFDNDPFVTAEVRKSQQERGGNGILTVRIAADGTQVAEHDIILGKNVPDYE
jgi:protocatechuate 3,4-dioxygenase, beta subunit